MGSKLFRPTPMDKYNFFQQTPKKEEGWNLPTTPQQTPSTFFQQATPFSATTGYQSQGLAGFPQQQSSVVPQSPASTFPPQQSSAFTLPPQQSSTFPPSQTQSNAFPLSQTQSSVFPPQQQSSVFPPQQNSTFPLSQQTNVFPPPQNTMGNTTLFSTGAFNRPAIFGTQQGTQIGGWSKGSKATPYTPTRFKEDNGLYADVQDITGMQEYSSKSVDEIRKEDYEASFCPPKPRPGIMPFGSNTQALPTGFGSSGVLGTTSPTGLARPMTPAGSTLLTGSIGQQSTPMFGSTQPSTSIFGASKPFSAPSVAESAPPFGGTSLFGAKPITAESTPVGGVNTFGNTSNFLGNASTLSSTGFGSTGLFNNNVANSSTGGLGTGLGQTGNSNAFGNVNTPGTGINIVGGANPLGTFGSSTQGPMNTFGNTLNTMNATNTQGTMNMLGNNTLGNTMGNTSLFNNASTINTGIGASMIGSGGMSIKQPDFSDPYLIKDINFEKFEQQKPSVKVHLPVPFFSTVKNVATVDLKLRPSRQVSQSQVYTIPNMSDVSGVRSISNLVIGFEGRGRIEFMEPVEVSAVTDLEKKIQFRNENVEISDPIGTGLNKRARVYVEDVFPVSRATNEVIRGKAVGFPQKGIQERFIYQLKNDENKKFIDYNVDTGVYVYEVNHF